MSAHVHTTTQVLDGGYNDIILRVLTPINGRQLEREMRSKTVSMVHYGGDPGTYSFCVDNTFSLLTPKRVFISIHVRSVCMCIS